MSTVRKSSPRAGWQAEEEELLFHEVDAGRRAGLPLKAVFQLVAERTGRKPNSIRNYYYMRIREDSGLARAVKSTAFVPFTEEESDQLLRQVLTQQARGISVRACTLNLGGGDTRAMLRYQNKYRALLKNDPERVRRIAEALKSEGVPVRLPLSGAGRSADGRACQALQEAARELTAWKSTEAASFCEALIQLSRSAAGETRQKESCRVLKEQVRRLQCEVTSQRESYQALLSLYRQLLSVNREFLGMAGKAAPSALSDYLGTLSSSVADCERRLP